jgi:SDR family mycofactocin-dependent oxidoreductase
MNRLDGRVAWVTGAARGQGRCHALALADRGATIIATDITEQIASVPYEMGTAADLAETVRLVEAAGGRCVGIASDVRDRGSVANVVDAAEQLGGVDVLVANAAIVSYARVEALDAETWADVIDTNLTGVFNSVHAVLPHMREQRWGRIVATTSMGGRQGLPNGAHYAASKWGVIGFIKTVAMEVGRDGITANLVAPATTATPMVMNQPTFDLFRPDLEHPTADDAMAIFAKSSRLTTPLLDPEHISRAVVYLVCDAETTSGAVLPVCLGSSALGL